MLVEPVGTGMAAVDSPVVHTAVVDMAVAGKTAVAGHTAAQAGTVAAENKHQAAVVAADKLILEVEDKHAEAVLDLASGLEAAAIHNESCPVLKP